MRDDLPVVDRSRLPAKLDKGPFMQGACSAVLEVTRVSTFEEFAKIYGSHSLMGMNAREVWARDPDAYVLLWPEEEWREQWRALKKNTPVIDLGPGGAA